MRTNYVLIDDENVQPEIVAALAEDHFKVLVFIGAKRGLQRPASGKTLTSSVSSLFQPKLGDNEVSALPAELQRNSVFILDGNKVRYSLPD